MAAQTNPSSVDSSPYESVGPNSVSDQPTKQDRLGFAPYVQAVCAFLLNPHTEPPLTFSVEGTWGSGKSSFMRQLEAQIKERAESAKKKAETEGKQKANEQYEPIVGKTVWFNAWRHDRDDELWAAFALVFTNELARSLPFWKRWLLHFKLIYRRYDKWRGWFPLVWFLVLMGLFATFTGLIVSDLLRGGSTIKQLLNEKTSELSLLQWLSSIGGSAAYISLIIVLIRKLAGLVGNPFKIKLTKFLRDPNYEAHAAFLETFHSDFERLIEIYSEGQRIFVFVDDLDRCDVPKAAELMQAINLLISESQLVVYILGLDREKIAAGLAAKYKELLPFLTSKKEDELSIGISGSEFGYNFLEKFIQIPFFIPQPTDSDVDNLLDSLNGTPEAKATGSKSPSDLNAGLLVQLSRDSDKVHSAVKMVAPSFDYNPRRLKQFVNLLRLRALIASQTGLFGDPRDPKSFDRLTFEQLAKLVAIALRWPLLLLDVENDLKLLARLQAHAWEENDKLADDTPAPTEEYREENDKLADDTPTPTEEYWWRKPKLMELIKYCGTASAESNLEERKKIYDLSRIDLKRFLQVSPVVPGREEYTDHTSTDSGQAPRDPDSSTERPNTPDKDDIRESPDQSSFTPERSSYVSERSSYTPKKKSSPTKKK
jgi:ribosome modulation factor